MLGSLEEKKQSTNPARFLQPDLDERCRDFPDNSCPVTYTTLALLAAYSGATKSKLRYFGQILTVGGGGKQGLHFNFSFFFNLNRYIVARFRVFFSH